MCLKEWKGETRSKYSYRMSVDFVTKIQKRETVGQRPRELLPSLVRV